MLCWPLTTESYRVYWQEGPTGRVSALSFSTVRDLAHLYIVHLQSIATIKPSAKDSIAYLRKLPGWFLDLELTAVPRCQHSCRL